MKIKGKELNIKQIVCLSIYYGILYYLPGSGFPLLGKFLKSIRFHCCRNIFKKCGKNVNIERGAFFASGTELSIGNYSGLGYHCHIPSNTIIGNYVMMGPNLHILQLNHNFDRVDIPMNKQGKLPPKQTMIEDDVWIGRDVLFTPGRVVKEGTLIAARTVLTKDFEPYSIVGGNPSRLIRKRK